MNAEAVPHLVSPKKKSALRLVQKRRAGNRVISGRLVSKDGTESFPVVAGIPLLQPEGHPAEWGHPIYKILLGHKAFEFTKRFWALGPDHSIESLSAYVRDTLGKRGIREAFERYGSR